MLDEINQHSISLKNILIKLSFFLKYNRCKNKILFNFLIFSGISPTGGYQTVSEYKEIFNAKAFLSKRGATKANSFLYKFSETILFANFIQTVLLNGPEKPELDYFGTILYSEPTKAEPYVFGTFQPNKTQIALTANNEGVDTTQCYQYTVFPKLDPHFFVVSRPLEPFNDVMLPLSSLKKEDDITKIEKMTNSEWAKYLIECIFDIWFTVFSDSIKSYPNLYHIDFIRYSNNFLNLIKKRYRPLTKLELFYKRLIEACGICGLKEEAAKIFTELKKELDVSIETFHSFFQACGNTGLFASHPSRKLSDVQKKHASFYGKEQKLREKLYRILHKVVVEIPTKCPNPECDSYFREEELFNLQPRSFHMYSTTCPACGKSFVPNLTVSFSEEKVKSFNFLFPPLLLKEITNLINNKGSGIFSKSELYKSHKVIFWNLIFYFRLINQPYFVLDLNYITTMTDILKQIRKQPVLPTKMAEAKPQEVRKKVAEIKNSKLFSSFSHIRVEGDGSSIGRSEPDCGKYSSRKDNSSIASGPGDQDKTGNIVSAHLTKIFGPLFEEYRHKKVDMRVELLGAGVHIPFMKMPVMKTAKSEIGSAASRKAVDIATPVLSHNLELKSNDFANAIIDESQTTSKTETHSVKSTFNPKDTIRTGCFRKSPYKQ